MDLSSLTPAPGSIKKRKRIGRGQGSGKGGTSTRGHKGAQSRSGYSRKRGFEGGQMPLHKRVPKFGFKNINKIKYVVLNLDTLESLSQQHNTKKIDLKFMLAHGLLKKKDVVKILGRGALKTEEIQVEAHAFSQKAKNKINEAKGKIVPIS